MKITNEIVDRFLSWPLPYSVCADLCATKQQDGRIGTNLLTANEAKQMLEHVLEPLIASVRAEAIEEAAKVCEELATRNQATMDKLYPGEEIDESWITLSGAVSNSLICAAACRALVKERKGE